jgi:hypothetical protein
MQVRADNIQCFLPIEDRDSMQVVPKSSGDSREGGLSRALSIMISLSQWS